MNDPAPVAVLRALYLADDVLDRIEDDSDRMRAARTAIREAIPLTQGMAVDSAAGPWTGWPSSVDLQLSRIAAELGLVLDLSRSGGSPEAAGLAVARVVGAIWNIRRSFSGTGREVPA